MFGSNTGTPAFPVFFDESQLQYDPNASTQLQLFGNYPTGVDVNPVNYVGNDQISPLDHPNKRSREADDVSRQQMLQFSLGNFFQSEAGQSAVIPKATGVSTGLRLSYDDDEHHSTITSASGSMSSLPVMMSLSDNLKAEIDRQREEFDRYLKVQEEHILNGVREMRQRQMAAFLSTIEKGVARKLKEKELEIENINKKNKELVEKIKQVSVEAQSWHYRARQNESMVNVLKSNLDKATAQGADHLKEGCGDSDVDDAASSCVPPRKALSNPQMACRACKNKEVCMILLPCRHLCLCKDCEVYIDACPVCQSMKTAGVQVFLS